MTRELTATVSAARAFAFRLRVDACVRRRKGTAAAIVWMLSVVAPGMLIIFLGSPLPFDRRVELVAGLFDSTVARYLSYAPTPLLLYVVSGVFMRHPVAYLLARRHTPEQQPWPTARDAMALLVRNFVYWAALEGIGAVLLAALLAMTSVPHAAIVSWASRIAWAGWLAGTPVVASLTCVSAQCRSKRSYMYWGGGTAFLFGVLATGYRPEQGVPWLSGAIELALFAGNPKRQAMATLAALIWVAAALLAMVACRAARRRIDDGGAGASANASSSPTSQPVSPPSEPNPSGRSSSTP